MLMANLYVGQSGLQTSQNAINTTAHNMANLDTQGYTRQQVQQGTSHYQTFERDYNIIAWKQIGTGVNYNHCKQVRADFLDLSYRRENGRNAFYDVSTKAIEEIEDQLQEMYGQEFALSLNNFWTSVQELAKDPCSAVNQSAMVTRANEFLTRAKSVYEGFVAYQDNMDATIAGIVENINNYGDKIRELNQEIAKIEAGKQEHANDQRDARNLLLDKLGEYGKIDYEEDIFGNVSVLFEGTAFVTTDHVNHIGIDTRLESTVGYATPYWEFAARTEVNSKGEKEVISIDGARIYDLSQTVSSATDTDIGRLKGVLLARGDHHGTYHDIQEDENFYNKNIAQSVIMNVESEFDQLIHEIMVKVNEVLEDAESNPATLDTTMGLLPSDFDLFVVANPEDKIMYDISDTKPGSSVYTGFTIMNSQVNTRFIENPNVFTFRTIEGNEDIDTMTALKRAFTSEEYVLNPNVTTKNNFLTYYNSLVSQVANSGDVFRSIQAAQEQTVSAIDNGREEVTGVSSDEELEFMIMFQNAYNASSRYINVVSQMLEHLLNTLGS